MSPRRVDLILPGFLSGAIPVATAFAISLAPNSAAAAEVMPLSIEIRISESDKTIVGAKIHGYAMDAAGDISAHYDLFIVDKEAKPLTLTQLSLSVKCNTATYAPVRLFRWQTIKARLVDDAFVKFSEETASPFNVLSLEVDLPLSLAPAKAVCSKLAEVTSSKRQ